MVRAYCENCGNKLIYSYCDICELGHSEMCECGSSYCDECHDEVSPDMEDAVNDLMVAADLLIRAGKTLKAIRK